MSVISNNQLAGSAGQGGADAAYQIDRSVRLNSSDSAYLSRTPSSSGNRKTWTFNCWIKRLKQGGTSGTQDFILTSIPNLTHYFQIYFTSDLLYVQGKQSGQSSPWSLGTHQVFRDPSAWMMLTFVHDSTQASPSERFKVHLNGERITSFSENTLSSYLPQNSDSAINSTQVHRIGTQSPYSSVHSDLMIAETTLIDGQALDPTAFGEYDDNNVWQPIEYSGTYGTNGFHLDFSDNSTTAALGTDTSGNGNTWTVNNLSVASGAGNDSLVESPTNGDQEDTGAGGEVVGNYATLNPLDNPYSIVLSNGNLDWEIAGTSFRSMRGNFMMTSGKWYFETRWNTGAPMMGIARPSDGMNSHLGSASNCGIGNASNATYKDGSGNTSGVPSHSTGDILMCAFDADAGKVWFGANGSWYSSGDPAAGTNERYSGLTDGTWMPAVTAYNSSGNPASINFGQRPFAYTAPSGFKALCTTNLPDPTIADGSTAMDAVTYTGNGSTSRSITGLGFSPDLVWVKCRSNGEHNVLSDIVRGANKQLFSNLTNAEGSQTNEIQAFNSDGFDVGNNGRTNYNNFTYVAWAWDGGTSTVSNTDGSITSNVRANPSAGFSIVSYTGTGSSLSVGHGLNAAPELVIVKSRTSGYSWVVWHGAFGTASNTDYLFLESTAAKGGPAYNFWNNTVPTSSVVHIGTQASVNLQNGNYIAYCFAPVEGYSSFGSYTGTGSGNGTFVYTGFRPKFLMIKGNNSYDGGGSIVNGYNWYMYDSSRSTYNAVDDLLAANKNFDEESAAAVDFLSNGFKIRNNNAPNATAAQYYIAFAEHPFKTSRAR